MAKSFCQNYADTFLTQESQQPANSCLHHIWHKCPQKDKICQYKDKSTLLTVWHMMAKNILEEDQSLSWWSDWGENLLILPSPEMLNIIKMSVTKAAKGNAVIIDKVYLWLGICPAFNRPLIPGERKARLRLSFPFSFWGKKCDLLYLHRRYNEVPNLGLGPKWDQSQNLVPKKSQFCMQVPNFWPWGVTLCCKEELEQNRLLWSMCACLWYNLCLVGSQ